MQNIIAQRRADGSFVTNNGLYHVPNFGEWLEQWAELNAQFEADSSRFEQLPPDPEPSPPTLDEVRAAKLATFDALFTRLDTLKIRPAASITEAISKGQTPDPGDVYVLSETQAVTEENRRRRDLVAAAETVEAVQEVEVWWPE